MTNATPSPLTDVPFLRAVLDTVLPASADGRMPSAGSLAIEADLAAALAADARSGPLVTAGLASLRAAAPDFAALPARERTAAIEGQLAAHPALIPGFLRHLYLAYYQHPAVLVALGEPARPPFPEGFEVEPTDPELLAKIMARRG